MEEMAQLVETTIQHFGGLDVLIGNAVGRIPTSLHTFHPLLKSHTWQKCMLEDSYHGRT